MVDHFELIVFGLLVAVAGLVPQPITPTPAATIGSVATWHSTTRGTKCQRKEGSSDCQFLSTSTWMITTAAQSRTPTASASAPASTIP